MDTQIFASQNGSRKANVTEEMAKKARKNAKKPNILTRIVNGIGGKIRRLLGGKPFDEIIDELNTPGLDNYQREKLIKKAEKRIERIENSSWIKDSMTNEEKEFMLKRQADKVAEMKMKLQIAKGESEKKFIPFSEQEIPVQEEPVIYEEPVIETGENVSHEEPVIEVEEEPQISLVEEEAIPEPEVKVEEDVHSEKSEEIENQETVVPEVEETTLEEDNVQEEPEEEIVQETKSEDKGVNDNLEAFSNYGEYVVAFIEANIAKEDRLKVYANIIEDRLPAQMLSRQEFFEERKNQIFQKKQKEYEDKAIELKKEIAERERELKESKDFIESALGKIIKQEKELQSLKDETADLERKLFDETTANTGLEQDKKDLISKVKEREEVIQSQGKDIFRLQRRGDKAEAACERSEKTIEKLEEKIAELKEKLAKKNKEISESKARLKKVELNIKTKLDAITPDEELKRLEAIDDSKMDELEETAVKYRKEQLVKEIKEEAKAEEKAIEIEKASEDYVKEKKAPAKKAAKKTKKDKKAPKHLKTPKVEEPIVVEEPIKTKESEKENTAKVDNQVQGDIASELKSLSEARKKLMQLQELEDKEEKNDPKHMK